MNSTSGLTDQEICTYIKKMLKTDGDPFSPESKKETEDFTIEYGQDLLLEAARLAKREGVQQISTVHVEEAKKRVLSIDKRNLLKRLCGNFGGLLVGIGASPLISLWIGSLPLPSVPIIIFSAILVAIGTGALVFSIF